MTPCSLRGLIAHRQFSTFYRSGTRLALFVLLLTVAGSVAPVLAGTNDFFDQRLDADGNGLEDALDAWLRDEIDWPALREIAVPRVTKAHETESPPADLATADGPWVTGRVRLICFGKVAADLTTALSAARQDGGFCSVIGSIDRFGGVAGLAVDAVGLRNFLRAGPGGRIMLDRDGSPALSESLPQIGLGLPSLDRWSLGDDWTGSIAILDSGCDTAHDDLGDYLEDNNDGPPPAVGDAFDWYSAEGGWIHSQDYKVFGWHDVTDDFPAAAGPWDYHYHGTALAGVVAGSGAVDSTYQGVAPAARLTIVKYYDFDGIWHQWAFDFLAACDWVLDNHELYRIRILLAAVNWDADAGISDAMSSLAAVGILPVVASGNHGEDGSGPWYPASSGAALTVGGVNDAGAVAAFSGRGSAGLDKPDLVAPSGGLLAESGRITTTDNEPNDTYSPRYGTSLAAAHVAGAAFLIQEAMRKEGYISAVSSDEVNVLRALLKMTAARVTTMEDASGEDTVDLDSSIIPNRTTGWGLLQTQAAIQAVLNPLVTPGSVRADSLSFDTQCFVAACRVIAEPSKTFRIDAIPNGSLDLRLEYFNTNWYEDPELAHEPIVVDEHGGLVPETLIHRGEGSGIAFVVAKWMSGYGRVTFEVSEVSADESLGFDTGTDGTITGWLNSGNLSGTSTPSVVFSSDVVYDPDTRAVNVLRPNGYPLAGWPSFVFVAEGLSGDLSAPLVWDLDGNDIDEVVVASDFGMLYFFSASGQVSERELVLNRGLTSPVGVIDETGFRTIVVVDDAGILTSYSAGPVIQETLYLDNTSPFAPAVGQLTGDVAEELVVAFPDGEVFVLDAHGSIVSGWPVSVGATLSHAPVLIDFDEDGYHEIYLPQFDVGTGTLIIQALLGNGLDALLDGESIPAPGGGYWKQVSAASVAGGYYQDDLRLVVSGLATNGAAADQEQWTLALGVLGSAGAAAADPVPGFALDVTTPAGNLDIVWSFMPPPLSWNYAGDGSADPEILAMLAWQELVAGSLNRHGATLSFFRPESTNTPAYNRYSWRMGGCQVTVPSAVSTCLFPLNDNRWGRTLCMDNSIHMQVTKRNNGSAVAWASARADSRNTGAYPLRAYDPSVVETSLADPRLATWPNPSHGRCHIAWSRISPGVSELAIYDLRGRLIRSFRVDEASGNSLIWDGRDSNDRPAAAGSYLFVLKHPGGSVSGKVLLTR